MIAEPRGWRKVTLIDWFIMKMYCDFASFSESLFRLSPYCFVNNKFLSRHYCDKSFQYICAQ